VSCVSDNSHESVIIDLYLLLLFDEGVLLGFHFAAHDISQGSYVLLVENALTVGKLVGRVLDEGHGFFSSLSRVEVHVEAANRGSPLRVHLILEADKEVFQGADVRALLHVRDVQRRFEDR